MQDVDYVNAPDGELTLEELDDGELLALARLDHPDAYAVLFTRYAYAAHRLARHLGQREEAEDVVSEAFAQILDLLRRGKGPDTAFRAYLFTTIRHESGRRAKARQRVMPTDDESTIDTIVAFGAGHLDEFEKSTIRDAYQSLPERWRTVLWHLDVEGRKPSELGPLLNLKPNTVSALVYRARSGLRDAYLQQHINTTTPTDSRACHDIRSTLPGFIRRTISNRQHEKIHTHLHTCHPCMTIYLDLQETNREVGAIVAPVALAVSVGGAVAGAAAGWVAHLGQLALIAKGIVLTVTPPAAAAAITTATLVGLTSADVSDPPRDQTMSRVTAGTGSHSLSAPPPASVRVPAAVRPTAGRSSRGKATKRDAASIPSTGSTPRVSATVPHVRPTTAPPEEDEASASVEGASTDQGGGINRLPVPQPSPDVVPKGVGDLVQAVTPSS